MTSGKLPVKHDLFRPGGLNTLHGLLLLLSLYGCVCLEQVIAMVCTTPLLDGVLVLTMT